MNLVNGKIISGAECDDVLEKIDEMITATLCKPLLDVNTVMNACDYLACNIESLEVINRLPELGVSNRLAEMYLGQIKEMLSAEALKNRIKTELGDAYDKPRTLTYLHSGATAVQMIAPLGVLFHITAGNVDGLPFVSVLEGLLTGNINIVKLPKEEGGITVSLLEELFKVEPSLREYVYVFDYSSKDIYAMNKLAKVADAIVIWGGDEAVKAVRSLADPNTKIIEWGHKISFAYVTMNGINNDSLERLAENICLTNQLFCSSCQGVFLDTDDMEEIYTFCEMFLPILERISYRNPIALDSASELFAKAQVTLQLYHAKIENRNSDSRIFRGRDCSISAYSDSILEPSIMYRNIWVKPLKKEKIISLRPYKGYLQTAALICSDDEHDDVSRNLLQTGLVKISDGFDMSNYAFGEAHDGVFTLRGYTKLVSVQK
ncbi:MAG: acyl-CoA reductase [Oscillospiraceae bacterium]|nr:acyl-CoA reductase [Oscillospiraceae bacterium]